ncbi:cell wall hydrolase [Nitratireductor kimnyeongensis]|uniref:Cell wall hydrolase n=1 Tax=Nitratireductor kimnyeongensis TaxID=430679 RepID=A0ABW0TDI7_9HYPH|nr:cell wall hydrolase [Nitratireductor kimnyeongensis]
MTCLSAAVYHEARGEPVDGQKAVAMVIVNRVRSASYPSTICGVVFQNAHRPYRCQFSFTCTGVAVLPKEEKPWRRAREVAASMQNCLSDCTREAASVDGDLQAFGAATHYHASYVRPRWARRLQKLGRIGRHIFFARKTGGPV